MSLELIKKLREQTGAGMSDCKRAVDKSNGNYDEALKILREAGQQIASKKSSRATSEGFLGFIDTEDGILIIELNCETDFVSRGNRFQEMLDKILFAAKESGARNQDDVLSSMVDSVSIKDFIAENIGIIGENIKIGSVTFLPYENNHAVGVYVHNAIFEKPHLGVIISVVNLKTDKKNNDSKEIARKIAMHVAASVPVYISVDKVDQKRIEEERAILKEQMKDTKKPENVINSIIEGRMRKFFEEIVLLEQLSVHDNSLKIKDWVAKETKSADLSGDIVSFVRIKLGEGISS